MVNDQNDALGCALSRFQENGYKYNYIVCNYSYTNILQRPVYEKGHAASKCKRKNSVYKGLCTGDQKVSHVPWENKLKIMMENSILQVLFLICSLFIIR